MPAAAPAARTTGSSPRTRRGDAPRGFAESVAARPAAAGMRHPLAGGRDFVSDVHHLFVYGTLRRGFGAHGVLAGRAEFAGAGWMAGRLFDTGAYPAAAAPAAPGDRIRGELYRLPADAASLLRALDRYEGFEPADPSASLFRRIAADVATEEGRTVRAWAYLYHRPIDGFARIPSGDYADGRGR